MEEIISDAATRESIIAEERAKIAAHIRRYPGCFVSDRAAECFATDLVRGCCSVEVGKPDATFLLETKPRAALGLKTMCDHCASNITDTYFVVAMKRGEPIRLFHEQCLPLEERTDQFRERPLTMGEVGRL